MEHIAIMKKSWGFVEKILSGEKTIESRWYLNKSKPWDVVKVGETIYFKNSGGPVSAKADVEKVLQSRDLTQNGVRNILDEYARRIGIEKPQVPEFFERFKHKKYCILIFLKNPQKVEPFEINKAGFGAMSAWITVDNILKLSIT